MSNSAKSFALAAGVTVALIAMLFLARPSDEQGEPRAGEPQARSAAVDVPAAASPGAAEASAPRPAAGELAVKTPGAVEPLTDKPAAAVFAELMAKHTKNGRFADKAFEGELARHLFHRRGDTGAAIEFFLEQTDPAKAHVVARAIAGTLGNDEEARKRILAILDAPPSPVHEEMALYALLASQPHEDVQEQLVDIFTSDRRSATVRTTAAFVIREGLSSLSEDRREKARGQARSFLEQSYGQGAAPISQPMRVECLAMVGGHLDPSTSDMDLFNAALANSSSRDEVSIALAMLIRHQQPHAAIYAALEKRMAAAGSAEERAMFEELIRSTRAALAPTEPLPVPKGQ